MCPMNPQNKLSGLINIEHFHEHSALKYAHTPAVYDPSLVFERLFGQLDRNRHKSLLLFMQISIY